jgi:hypothetical protein
MKVDLRQTRTLVISCAGEDSRRSHVHAQLSRVGMRCEFVDGIRCQPGVVGCALSHLKILTDLADALPLLVLEDDCSLARAFLPELDIPPEADLAYLGVSVWGVFPEVHPYGIPMASIATRHGDRWLRLHNMLSTHALLYLTPGVVRAARDAIIRCLVDSIPFDVGFALLQKQWLALTPSEPYFFQDARFRGAEEATRQRLIPVDNPADVHVTRAGDALNISRPLPACQPLT